MAEKKVQKRTIESREKILTAAWKLFCEKGYFNTNTKEIAGEAGIAVGSFYNYYKDKLEVYYELTSRYLDGSADAVRQLEYVMVPAADKREALKEYIYTQMDRANATGRFFSDAQVLVQDSERLNFLFAEDTKAVIASIEELIPKIPGVIDRAPTNVMARILFTMIDNMAEDACSPTNIGIYEEYRAQMTLIVQNYLFGDL